MIDQLKEQDEKWVWKNLYLALFFGQRIFLCPPGCEINYDYTINVGTCWFLPKPNTIYRLLSSEENREKRLKWDLISLNLDASSPLSVNGVWKVENHGTFKLLHQKQLLQAYSQKLMKASNLDFFLTLASIMFPWVRSFVRIKNNFTTS